MNLNQVTLAVSDVARAIGFYQQLGLQLIVESLPEYARFCCPDGSATFSVSRVERVQPSQSLVYFECNELDATVQRLQALGVDQVYGNDGSAPWCTVGNPLRFFSYRRDGVSGRMAACIWLA